MKITKKGRIKLDFLEIQVGKFCIKQDNDHMKIQDINGKFSFRAIREMPVGAWIESMWRRSLKEDKSAINTLNVFCSTLWSVFALVPDDGYIKETLEMVDRALDRHPEWYGIEPKAPEAEPEKAE